MPLGLQKAFEPKATGSNGGSNSRSKEKEIFSQTTLLPKIKGESGFYIDRGRMWPSSRSISRIPGDSNSSQPFSHSRDFGDGAVLPSDSLQQLSSAGEH
ncbi:hypothetical protein ACLKA6_000231 [Drosophila palustris]